MAWRITAPATENRDYELAQELTCQQNKQDWLYAKRQLQGIDNLYKLYKELIGIVPTDSRRHGL